MARADRVVVIGEALIDVVEPTDGPAREHVGGSPANVAVGLATLGHGTRLAAHIGRDDRGRRIVDHLQEHGVGLVDGSDRAVRTSTATARLDPQGGAGGATYVFDLTWEAPEVDLTGAGHLHAGSLGATVEPGGSAVLELMSRARDSVTVSYDPNLRPTLMGEPHEVRGRIEECIGRSDVVKASEEDIEWLYVGAPLAEVAHLWGLLGPSVVVVTRGGDGALVHLTSTDTDHQQAGRRVEVVDTVGAGDSFMTGLLSGLLDADLLGGTQARERLRAASLEDVLPAVERAVDCASYTVERAGAAAPTRSELGITD
ncbi:carbohydrate kinase family protein [Ornithinicoccus hortensis]|uniref:Fructokinase n=1 Tax=Ornithinicoccus hortensis TaxID=82346 RepID=A0A542YPN7_9MICO|nr:carbohydrate kinase [Ornithinicoccus hortensis]TQL50072.1 fructokinase [Ornithinicoccus hortensis]